MTQNSVPETQFKILLKNEPNVTEKFSSLILNARECRLTLLNQSIEFLAGVKDEGAREIGVINFIKSILSLIVSPVHIPDDVILEITNFMITQAKHFDSRALTKSVANCFEFIKEHPDLNLPVRWIEIFGKLVSVLVGRGEIDDEDGDPLEGSEYKSRIVNEICRLPWFQNNGASLIAVLREIPGINSIEIGQVLTTAGRHIQKFDPSAIPPIAYQLLLLSSNSAQAQSQIIKHFDDYFLQIGEETLRSSSSDSDRDLEASRLIQVGRVKALGTTVFHFVQAAGHSESFQKEILRRIKRNQLNYGSLMTPFMISLALGLTSIETLKPVIVESLRTAVIRQFIEIQLSTNYNWFWSCSGTLEDKITACFESLFSSSPAEMDFMLEGLKDLALGLLTHDYGRDVKSRDSCVSLGTFLLKSIVSRHPEFLPKLINEFLKNQKQKGCIDCLAKCLSEVRMTLINKRFSGRIVELIHHLPLMTVESAVPILKALLPALQLSSDLLGEVMMVMRKTIWKSVEARKISVSAMVLLLSNSQLVGSIPKNLYSQSQCFSQICEIEDPSSGTNVLGSAGKNEQLCSEVLQMMKRFFSQQIEVREHLYLGLQSIVRRNPELVTLVCKNLLSHVQHYMTSASDNLDLSNILECDINSKVSRLENPGLLIQSLSQIILKAEQVYADDNVEEQVPPVVTSARKILDVWKEKLGGIGVVEIEEHTADLLQNRTLPLETVREVRDTLIILMMQIIEALLEFICLDGTSGTTASAPIRRQFKELFNQFNIYAKEIKVVKVAKKNLKVKKESKKKGNTTTKGQSMVTSPGSSTTNSSTNSSNKTSSTGGPKVKLPTTKKLIYPHIIQLNSIKVMLGGIYRIDNQSQILGFAPTDQILTPFELFLLSALKQKLNTLKHHTQIQERSQNPIERNKILLTIAHHIWVKLSQPRSDVDDDDDSQNQSQQADEFSKNPEQTRLSCLVEIFEYLAQEYPTHPVQYFSFFCGTEGDGFIEQFSEFFTQWKTYMENYEFLEEAEHIPRRLTSMFKLLHITSSWVSTGDGSVGILAEVKSWLQNFSLKCPYTSTPTIEFETMESFLKSYILVCSKVSLIPDKELLSLAKHAHWILTDLDEETDSFKPTSAEKSWLLNIKTAPIALHQFGIYIETTLDLIKRIIAKLNAQSQMSLSEADEEINDRWREICYKVMKFLLMLLNHCIRSNFPTGPCVDVFQRTVVLYFNTMSILTENLYHHLAKQKEEKLSSRSFETLVKLIGGDLKHRCDVLVDHIHYLRQENLLSSKTNKKKKDQDSTSAPVTIKHKFTKDAKTIPILVYSIEKYEEHLHVLSKNTKNPNLLKGTKLTTSRDFKVHPSKLSAAAKRAGARAQSATLIDSVDLNDSNSNTPSPQPQHQPQAGTSRSSRGSGKRTRAPSPPESENSDENEEDDEILSLSPVLPAAPVAPTRGRPGPGSKSKSNSTSKSLSKALALPSIQESDPESEDQQDETSQASSIQTARKPTSSTARRLNTISSQNNPSQKSGSSNDSLVSSRFRLSLTRKINAIDSEEDDSHLPCESEIIQETPPGPEDEVEAQNMDIGDLDDGEDTNFEGDSEPEIEAAFRALPPAKAPGPAARPKSAKSSVPMNLDGDGTLNISGRPRHSSTPIGENSSSGAGSDGGTKKKKTLGIKRKRI